MDLSILWTCQYCGSRNGMYYKDQHLEGFLCQDPECGRFTEVYDEYKYRYDSDI